jgi:hypothetical protein
LPASSLWSLLGQVLEIVESLVKDLNQHRNPTKRTVMEAAVEDTVVGVAEHSIEAPKRKINNGV